MAREDLQRRRLRGLYERNKRRGDRIADLRDRRSGDDDVRAPRRYVVSERQTRIEGFGRGGTQIRRVVRTTAAPSRRMRFADSGIFRRGGRDRFIREDDIERALRRERFRDRRGRRGGAREIVIITEGGRRSGEGAQFGASRRRRLRLRRERRREDGELRRDGQGPRQGEGRRRGGEGRRRGGQENGRGGQDGRRGGEGRRRHGHGNGNGNSNGQQQQQQQRRQQKKRDELPTRDQLDAELDRYRRD